MTQLKKCPHCFRSYPDISLNFCLDDGAILSDSFEDATTTDADEIETRVRIPRKKRTDIEELDSWQYEKTVRTKSEHPISTSSKTSDKPFEEWTASDFVRNVTYQITGSHTFHAQECLELLRNYVNSFIGNEDLVFRKSSWQLGRAHFYSYRRRFTYNFQKQGLPSATDFLLNLLLFSTDWQETVKTIRPKNRQYDSVTEESRPRRIFSQNEPGYEYIRAAVAEHPNLGLVVHRGLNHRITKNGHTGSMWITPRHGGVSITANGQAAFTLYREMERLLGPHHREDAKEYRYFQANNAHDVEMIIGLWAAL